MRVKLGRKDGSIVGGFDGAFGDAGLLDKGLANGCIVGPLCG